MNGDKYYIYYIRKCGEGMFLSSFTNQTDSRHNRNEYRFTSHCNLHSFNQPIFFVTLEQAETFLEIMKEECPMSLEADSISLPTIGRWLTMSQAQRNQHNDPYEWATWRPDES